MNQCEIKEYCSREECNKLLNDGWKLLSVIKTEQKIGESPCYTLGKINNGNQKSIIDR